MVAGKRGEELEDFGSTRRTPSDWWLVGYFVDKLIGFLAGRKQQNEEKQSTVDPDNAC